MKPYSPLTNKGRKRSLDDIHHKTADMPRADAKRVAKAARHGARQAGRRAALVSLTYQSHAAIKAPMAA